MIALIGVENFLKDLEINVESTSGATKRGVVDESFGVQRRPSPFDSDLVCQPTSFPGFKHSGCTVQRILRNPTTRLLIMDRALAP
jgi:hypothetical protein